MPSLVDWIHFSPLKSSGERGAKELRSWSKMRGYMGVSKNDGTPKWMVYNGKPY